MSRSLRYKNPVICDYLASQYVVAVMTPLVRSRMETLRKQVPELNHAIAGWSDKFAILHDHYPEVSPSPLVWHRIEKNIEKHSASKRKASITRGKTPWWNNLLLWKLTSIGASMASFALVLVLFLSTQQQTPALISSTPSYLAVMSAYSAASNKATDIRFIVNVYEKTATAPTRVFVQWSENHPRTHKQSMHLWAEDKNTGELIYVGSEPKQQQLWELTKPTWLAITNSSRLLFTSDANVPTQENTLFAGPCIQLGSWKQNAI